MVDDVASSRTPLYKQSPLKVFRKVRQNYKDMEWWRTQLRLRMVTPVHEALYGYKGVNVMEEDWDNFIVLDACRADLFEEVANLDQFDSYERKTSRASNTTPWTYRNFTDGTFGDTVYVSANPVTSKAAPHAFHELIEVWADLHDDSVDVPTNDETGQVLPKHTVEHARAAAAEYPDKRLITHFIPPHAPFLERPELIFNEGPPPGVEVGINHEQEPPRTVWEALRLNEVSRDAVWEGYADNLRLGLTEAVELAQDLDGRTIITSDHGNLLGERSRSPIRFYGHPRGLRSPELIEVPWAVVEGDSRRDIVDGGAHSRSCLGEEEMYDQLRNLGYFE